MLSGSSLLRRKVDRILEAATLVGRSATDLASRQALLACYAGIVRDPNDPSEVDLTIASGALRCPVRMRKSDIYTLAEVFRERQYDLDTTPAPAPFVIDAGANVGFATLWFLGRYPGARVHCFEPAPGNLELLRHNVGNRPDVVINAAALGRDAGRLELHLAASAAMHSLKDEGTGEGTVGVDVVNLAAYLDDANIDRVDVLKLDVEGSELDVLEGMERRLDRVHIIVGELHETLVDGTRFYSLLERHGFRRVRRAESHESGVHLFEVARPA